MSETHGQKIANSPQWSTFVESNQPKSNVLMDISWVRASSANYETHEIKKKQLFEDQPSVKTLGPEIRYLPDLNLEGMHHTWSFVTLCHTLKD